MMLFEVRAPDGREIRQSAESAEALRASLIPGYEITGVVHLAKADGSGGFVAPIGEGPTLMTALLEAHGDELMAWLRVKARL